LIQDGLKSLVLIVMLMVTASLVMQSDRMFAACRHPNN